MKMFLGLLKSTLTLKVFRNLVSLGSWYFREFHQLSLPQHFFNKLQRIKMEDDQEKSCSICGQNINAVDKNIECQHCGSLYHQGCTIINDNIEVWTCPRCKTGVLMVPPPPMSHRSRSHCSQRKSISSSSSKVDLLLQSIEEEKKMLEDQQRERQKLLDEKLQREHLEREKLLEEKHKLEHQLLMKKQQLLKDSCLQNDNNSSTKSVHLPVPSVSSKEKVSSWVNSNNNHQPLPETQPDVQPITQSTMCATQENVHANLIPAIVPLRVQSTVLNAKLQDITCNNQPPKDHITFHESQIRPTSNVSVNRILTKEQIAARQVLKDLPVFDGKPRAWPKFISSFQRSTDLCGFSDSENLERLSRCLQGSAYTAVETSLTLEDNVPRILQILELLFGKPEYIIDSLIEDMRKGKRPSMENVESILMYALEIENICCTMRMAKLSDFLTNPAMLSEMLERLPSQLKMSWAEYTYESRRVNIEVFSAWLKDKSMKLSSLLTKPPILSKPLRNHEKNRTSFVNVHNEIGSDLSCCVCAGSCRNVEVCAAFKELSYQCKWDVIKKNYLCRTCLRRHRGQCKKQQICGKNGCEFFHHELLHKPVVTTENSEEIVAGSLNTHASPTIDCIFKVLPVTIHNGEQKVNTFAMLDDCSSLTLISQELAASIGAHGPNQPMCLQWTSNIKRTEEYSQKLSLQISGKPGKLHQLKCRTVKNLSLPKQTLNYQQLSSKFPHLEHLPVSSYNHAEIGVLIGINNPTLLLTHNYKMNKEDEPIAAFTKLGCVVFGSNSSTLGGVFHVRECECFQNDVSLDNLLRESYAIEGLGLQKSVGILPTEDKRAYDIWEKTTKFLGSRYETGLLFKYDAFKLPNNYNMASRRLQCLIKKCEKEPGLRNVITKKIEEYETKGYARRVPQEEIESLKGDIWYLPIFVVRNPNKPSKVRLVWDAAATVGGTSLNSVLVKGPDLLSSLISVLLRFRQYKIAMSADIQEMFHQIRIRPTDQRYQMFMWPNEKGEIVTYAMVGMTFGASCSPATAQHIKNLNAEAFRAQYPRAVEAIVDNHYVDDLLESLENENEAIQLAKDVTEIHKKAGFHIRNWISNSKTLSSVFQEESSETKKTLDFPQEPAIEKILGMWWETDSDDFTYSLRYHKMDEAIWKGERSPTKREVLRAVMSIYDPLGLLSHVLIFPKILLQNIWRSESMWDEAINSDLANYWKSWLEILPRVELLKIPRWYGYSSRVKHVDLHVFTDASNEAYAAGVYIRFRDPDINQIIVRLVTAKSRVAPLKYMSIPRLELMGAVIGARLTETLKTSLKIPIRKTTFWSDSTCVLAWIHSDHRKYRPYVAARIGEILETTSASDWRYVPTGQNVADQATRMKLIQPTSKCAWYNGPDFLYEEEHKWPKNKEIQNIETEEMMCKHIASVNIHHAEITANRFSSWLKLCRVQAYVLRFIENLKSKIKNSICSVGFLSSRELCRAENTLYRQAQEESYSEEISCLESGMCQITKTSPIYKDMPYIDENKVMRARSRIDSVNNVPFSVKRPILLPKDNRITELIMSYYHKMYHHGNSETVINELRQKFIIPAMRVKLRSIKNRCQWCKNKSARPQPVVMGDLPAARLSTFTRAFSCIGIDYFGPLFVAVRRCREKRWVMLITCLTTRGIHLELVSSLSTDSCILGLRRFMSLKGTPRQIYSDNATNFKGASRELEAAMEKVNSKLIAQHFTTANTEWSFIPPASPHMGGAWERMVRSVKTVLMSTFPLKTTPNEETLMTLLLEAANIINSRPLTYVPLDNDTDEALTPNHFILGCSNGLKSLGDFQGDGSALKYNWKQCQLYTDVIWRKWIKEILPDLRRRRKWHTDGRAIKLNDIVLVIDDNTPRNCYKKARVIGLNSGHDGKVRSVSIQTEGGIYVRPVNKLAALDVHSETIDGRIPAESEGILRGSVENDTSSLHTQQSVRNLRPLPHRA